MSRENHWWGLVRHLESVHRHHLVGLCDRRLTRHVEHASQELGRLIRKHVLVKFQQGADIIETNLKTRFELSGLPKRRGHEVVTWQVVEI